jgi:hypothetical protein
MQITNEHGLPDTIVQAIRNDSYSRGDSDYSATDLINPTRITLLSRRHDDDIVEDAADRVWSLYGTMMHHLLEAAGHDNAIQEERLFWSYGGENGRIISGAPDLYHAATVTDYKVTSAWTLVYGSRQTEWEQQLNIYADLFRQHGFPVEKLQIMALLRDWTASKAKSDAAYPQSNVVMVSVALWEPERAREYIEARVADLAYFEAVTDDDLRPCTPEEMWEQPTKYAVMKEGRKSAVRVFDTQEAAWDYRSSQPKGQPLSVVERPGARRRCEEYCSVNRWCNQYQGYLKERGGE